MRTSRMNSFFFHRIEHDDQEGADGAEEKGRDEPEEAAAVFGLGEAGVDEGEGEPSHCVAAGVLCEFHDAELTPRGDGCGL